MAKLITVYTSYTPIACHIVKGRLESQGMHTYVLDENLVYVDPFYAHAIGGVKLKVSLKDVEYAEHILQLLVQEKLTDGVSEYDLESELQKEYDLQQKVLDLQSFIRKNPSCLKEKGTVKADFLSRDDLKQLLDSELKFQEFKNRTFVFSREKFWIEVFEGSVIDYFRVRPNKYYINRDIVEHYENTIEEKSENECPSCGSHNFRYGYAIGIGWDLWYLLFSLLVIAPFPLTKKRYHCFNCGEEFRKREIREQKVTPIQDKA